MGRADVVSTKPKPKPDAPKPKSDAPKVAVDSSAVAVQDTPRKDTAVSRTFAIKKGGEANLITLLPLDTTATQMAEMPPQGPEKADSLPPPAEAPEAKMAPAPQDTPPPTIDMDLLLRLPKLQRYTPSSMLAWGQWEAKFFQQVYSQTHYFDGQGRPQPQYVRSSYYTGIASLTLGCKSWFNFGVEAWLRSVRIDAPGSSPFKVLSFQSGPNSRSALSAIGPRLKFQPFKELRGFTVQTSLLIPVGSDMEANSRNQPYLATENLQWWTQFYYTLPIRMRWLLFAQVDAFASLNTGGKEQTQASSFALPVSVYMSYFPTQRLTIYVFNQVWPTVSTIWYQAGFGAKYRLTEGFELECSYGRFLAGIDAAGQANAFNFGLRLVKW